MAGGSTTEVAPVLEETSLSKAEPENGNNSKVELSEVLKRPDLLTNASYLLLSIKDLNPRRVIQKLNNFFHSGEIPPEDIAAYTDVQREHQQTHNNWKNGQLQEQHQRFEQAGLLGVDAENLDDVYCVHSTDYPPVQKGEQAIIQTTYQGSKGESFRTSVHFSLNHTVGAVSGMTDGHTWEGKDYVVISPFRGITELNGAPYAMKPEDTFWGVGVGEGVKLPAGTKIIAKRGDPKVTEMRKMEGIEIIEVDGDPHAQAAQVMQEKNIKVIYPKQFKGAQKIADQIGSFYGYHLGQNKRAGAESYLIAEAMIQSTIDKSQAEKVAKLVRVFNKGNESAFPEWAEFVNLRALHELTFSDYFSVADFPEVAFVHPANGHEVKFDEAISAMRIHYNTRTDKDYLPNVLNSDSDFHRRMVAWVGLNIFDRLAQMAKIGTKLAPVSKRMLEDRIKKVKDNFDIIPPQLIGSLVATTYPYL